MAVLQSLLKTAKAIEAEVVKHVNDPKEHRRQKFAAAILDQINMLDGRTTKDARRRRKQPDGSYAQRDVKVKVKSWVSKESTVLTPKYGNSLLEFEKGKCALAVTAKSLPDVLKQLLAATQAGELDTILEKVAASRPKPKKKVRAVAA
jgi:hypothetical protein